MSGAHRQILNNTDVSFEPFTVGAVKTLFATGYVKSSQFVKKNVILWKGTAANGCISVPLNSDNNAANFMGRLYLVAKRPGIRHAKNPKKRCRPHIEYDPASESSEYALACHAAGAGMIGGGPDDCGIGACGAGVGSAPVGAPYGPGVGGPLGPPPVQGCGPAGPALGGPGGLGGPGSGYGGYGPPQQQPYGPPQAQPDEDDGAGFGEMGGFGSGAIGGYPGGEEMEEGEFESPEDFLAGGGYHKRKMPKHYAMYNNSFGHLFIDTAALTLNKEPLIVHTGKFLDILDELTGCPSRPTDELIGRYKTERQLLKASAKPDELTARMRFFFCETPGNFLPIKKINPQLSKFSFDVKFRNIHDLYLTSDKRKRTVPRLIDSDQPLSYKDIKVEVRADLYYVTQPEEDDVQARKSIFLIDHVQYNGGHKLAACASGTDKKITYDLPFKGPVTQLIWTIQDQRHIKNRDFLNFSGHAGKDPIERFHFTVNKELLDDPMSGKQGRILDPLDLLCRVPNRHIYQKIWTRKPQDLEMIAGMLPFNSRLKYSLVAELQVGLEPSILDMYAISRNRLQIYGGKAELLAEPAPHGCVPPEE